MPRLFHRPPKYSLHKSTKQAVVSMRGKRIHLGPYGSPESHRKYQEFLRSWEAERNKRPEPEPTPVKPNVAAITPTKLREKRFAGSPLTINELVFVYRQHAREYYQKHGRVTREATIIDDAIRYLRKHHATTFLHEFGPVALDELRSGMIRDLGWSRRHINKQVRRLVRMFTWAAEKELVEPSFPMAHSAGPSMWMLVESSASGDACADIQNKLRTEAAQVWQAGAYVPPWTVSDQTRSLGLR